MPASMWIDTHCHIDAAEFAPDRDAVVARAGAAGVGAIIVPAVAAGNFADVQACAARFPSCLPAYGIHPLYVDQAGPDDLTCLRDWLARENPVAVGEIGLDHFVPGLDRARQYDFLLAQLRLAAEFDLPVLLHVRHAVDTVLGALRRVPVRSGIAHAFNGSPQQADAFIRLGFKLGFGGAMTWPRATRLRRLAQTLPIEAIVLETDAPDMVPVFAAQQRNEPGYLLRIADEIAALRGLDLAALRLQTQANAAAVFGSVLSDCAPTS